MVHVICFFTSVFEAQSLTYSGKALEMVLKIAHMTSQVQIFMCLAFPLFVPDTYRHSRQKMVIYRKTQPSPLVGDDLLKTIMYFGVLL